MNDFDPASFQLSPEQLAAIQQQQLERERAPRSGRKSRTRKVRARFTAADMAFVQVPWPGILQAIAAVNSGVATALLLGILFEVWRKKVDTVTLPTASFEIAGIHRKARTRGLHRLVAAGIIEIVERKPGCRPRIKLLWPSPRGNPFAAEQPPRGAP
jgi:hypothetical protein